MIDEGSKDNTVEKIRQWQNNYPNIKYILNSEKYVSHGFNIAFKSTKSKYFALMGAHAEYPKNYFICLEEFLELKV